MRDDEIAVAGARPGTERRAAASPTGCGTGCSPGSGTGASRSRSSTTTTACRSRCPSRPAAGRAAGDDRLRGRSPADERASRCRRWPGPRAGPTVELDLGDGRRSLPARAEHDAAVGRLVLVLPALPGPGQRHARSSTRRSSGTGWCPTGVTRRRRRRRPVRRRRRARRAAPAVRAVLAQGAVRPGPRVDEGAVPAAVQPGLHPGRRVHRRPRALRAGRRGRARVPTGPRSTTASR